MKSPENNFDSPDNTKEQLRQEFLERFQEFREHYLDDLPPYRINPVNTPEYEKYKCRGNFRTGLRNMIHKLIKEGVITEPGLLREGRAFIQYVHTGYPLEKTNPLGPKFSTQADIDYINHILDRLIAGLSS